MCSNLQDNSLIDLHFDNIESDIDLRFHSLEIQLDLLLESICSKIADSASITLPFSTTLKNDVGKLLVNYFYKLKSFSLVDFCGFPQFCCDYSKLVYKSCALRSGILYLLNEMYYPNQYVFNIYYSPTNIVKFYFSDRIFEKRLFIEKFSLDRDRVYFYQHYKIRYICDYDGKNGIVDNDYEPVLTTNFTKSTHIFCFNTAIVEILFNDLFVIVVGWDGIFFFHKNTLLFSHRIETFPKTRLRIFCLDDCIVFVDTYKRNYEVLFFSGEFKKFDFNCSLFDGIAEEYGFEDNKYRVCEITRNVIWFKPKVLDGSSKLLKLEF